MKYNETMWAYMRPDVYAGDNFDGIEPDWTGSADKEGEFSIGKTIELNSKHFPPGTKITIAVPICPQCEVSDADAALDHPTGEMGKCDHCGFDWVEWTKNKYS